MKKHHSFMPTILGLVVVASLLGGCSPVDRLTCPEPGEEIPAPGPDEEYVTFTLQNDTCMSICVLLVSPDHCEYMDGENWVQDHPLRSEESISMNIPPGKYAAWVEYCTEEFRADEHLKVNADAVHSFINPTSGNRPPCETSLTVVNNADVAICNLRIGISESVYTGWNWVGAVHIQPGESLFLTLRPDTYFIRAEDCDGNWLRSEVDVPISGDQTWTVP
ncbi:MAG: hypothetical protein K8R77_01240 [Anaerolineaceae bacterium]|nr:hypothetical protein [Anaerolineaceae bacterium]